MYCASSFSERSSTANRAGLPRWLFKSVTCLALSPKALSQYAATPSGSAPRKRPIADFGSTTSNISSQCKSSSKRRCAGSVSWNSSTMIVLKRFRSNSKSCGFLLRCAIAALMSSAGSIRIFESPAPLSDAAEMLRYESQNFAAAGQ